ncbi:hypothetical protein B9Q20_16250 [Enterobacter mori]|nr:hypothetical protein B9Q20_16250 [Enterobacter mori]
MCRCHLAGWRCAYPAYGSAWFVGPCKRSAAGRSPQYVRDMHFALVVNRLLGRGIFYFSSFPAIIPKISNRFRNNHDKTHLTRADAESGLSQQQESGESAAHGKEITRSGA